MTLSKKLTLMYVLALTALFGTCWLLLQAKYHSAMEERSAATRHLVESAHGILAFHEAAVASGKVNRAEAQSAAIAAIKTLRYEEKEYFWINDMHPKMVMHPIKPELDGKDLSAAKDPDGKFLFVEFVKTVQKNGQGFVSYLWPKPGMDKPVPKISYVKGFAPWGWVIGSGIYVDDVDAQFRRDLMIYGGVASLIALVLGALFWLLARSITGPLKRAVTIADAVSAGDLAQKIEVAGRGESAQLISALAKMQANLRERIEADRRATEEMARVKQALDVSAMPVRIADDDGKIVYINNKLRTILRRDEAAFRKEIPGFEAAKIEGGSIGMFYADPAAAIERLRKLENTTTAAFVLGGRNYDVTTTPVCSPEGKRLGTIGQWVDRTEQLAAETELKEIVSSASAGDFTRRVATEGKEGFFLQLAENLNGLLHTSETGLNEVSRVLGALAKGDLTEKITNDYQGTFGKLKDDCNKTVENLTSIVNQIKDASLTIDTASQEITQGNTDLSQRTEEQASSLEETASSMEELTSTVKQNAENARQANQLAVGASDVAVKGGDVVKQVVTTMSGISESSKKIADIIGTIDGIAFQTNILALNAAVEAARAGEQGRGFAVVASEVRNLAQRSANAAKEIKQLIGDSVSRVDTGSKLVNEAGKTMEEIVNSVKRVTDIMAEITAASQEQSSGIEQVNQAITQMDEVTQQNAALVEEAAAAAESMQEQAGNLVQTVAQFRLTRGAAALEAAFDFDAAIKAHDDWKRRLYDHLDGKGESLDPDKVGRDDCCALGGWIYGAGKRYASHPEYSGLKSAHAGFHQCAGNVVRLNQSRDVSGARALLDSDFVNHSKATIGKLHAMKQIAVAGAFRADVTLPRQAERRGPDRAVNVSRLPARPGKPAKSVASAPRAKAVGAEEDWQEF